MHEAGGAHDCSCQRGQALYGSFPGEPINSSAVLRSLLPIPHSQHRQDTLRTREAHDQELEGVLSPLKTAELSAFLLLQTALDCDMNKKYKFIVFRSLTLGGHLLWYMTYSNASPNYLVPI